MDNLVRIEFEERDDQWTVLLVDQDREAVPGEPFPTRPSEEYSKLRQVLDHVADLGYVPARIPYNRPNASRYIIEVKPN